MRIEIHLHSWVKRSAHIFRQACEAQGVYLEQDELIEALHQIREVKFEAKQYAATMARAFWDDLQELREEIHKVKQDATQLVKSLNQIIEERPDINKALRELQTETTALREVLELVAHARTTSEWTTPQAVERASQKPGQGLCSSRQVTLQLRERRAIKSAELDQGVNLTRSTELARIGARGRSVLARLEARKGEATLESARRGANSEVATVECAIPAEVPVSSLVGGGQRVIPHAGYSLWSWTLSSNTQNRPKGHSLFANTESWFVNERSWFCQHTIVVASEGDLQCVTHLSRQIFDLT